MSNYEILLFGENQPEISIDRISDFDDFLNDNIRLYDNLDQITKDFHESLVSLLKINNLEVLVEECEKCNFHCHTHFTFEEILLNENNRDIYLCDGC